MTNLPEWIQAGAAVATLLAALAALVVAAKAPRMAAQFAEQYRRETARDEDRQRLRIGIFTALMRGRRAMLHPDTVAALNLIDVGFIDSQDVRDAWRSFVVASETEPYEAVRQVERFHALIAAVAREVGFAEHLRSDDIRLGYYPLGQGKLDQAAFEQAEETIARRAAAAAIPPSPHTPPAPAADQPTT